MIFKKLQKDGTRRPSIFAKLAESVTSTEKTPVEGVVRVVDTRVAADILSYLITQIPGDTSTFNFDIEGFAQMHEEECLKRFLHVYVQIAQNFKEKAPAEDVTKLYTSAARAFGEYPGAELFLFLLSSESFQQTILFEHIANTLSGRLLQEVSQKKVQVTVAHILGGTLLQNAVVQDRYIAFAPTYVLFRTFPPESFSQVYSTLSELIRVLYGALTEKIGNEAAQHYIEGELRTLGESFGALPIFHAVIRGMPRDIVNSSYLETLSKAELEEQVRQRTEEISKNSARLQKLLEERDRLAAFPRNHPDPIIGANTDGRIVYVNPAGEQLALSLKLPSVESLLPPSHQSYLSECIISGKQIRAEISIGHRTFEWLYVPLPNYDAVHLYASDISDKKQLESLLTEANTAAKMLIRKDQEVSAANDGLRDLNEELSRVGKELVQRDLELTEANNRLIELDQMKSEFVSVAAHQLRTPLTGIRWTLHALVQKELGPITPEQEQFAHAALKTVITAVDLINDLLNVARLEEGRFGFDMKQGSVVEVLKMSTDKYAPVAAEKGVYFNVDISAAPPPLVLDREKLQMVFDNLIDNAIKYTEPGKTVSVGLFADAARVRIVVSDTGIGVPEIAQRKLFSKFFRAPNAVLFQTSGTGLGLYIVKNVIERHKGTIDFTSVEGQGTTFTITIPLPVTK